MAYTVLARRYRSDSFRDVVGQEPIARTLLNAIKKGRVAHAYLFTGTRGVGKTSMARLLARALNAPETLSDAPKPPKDVGYGYPPKAVQQRMADAIMRGEDLNVIEIDGASNRGVDEARQLIANAGLAPTGQAVHKIYIIDEVHMLTREAFNTLLKTMEEPPSHVKFVLCTTEPHKVPATIQSRCQRFDFRNITTAAIAGHLASVLEREKVEAETDLVHHVARLGNGSMRDALSLLDRLIATGEQPLTMTTLELMLGLPPREGVVKLIDALADGDVAAALTCVDRMLNNGTAQEQIIGALTDRLHELMLLAACGQKTTLVDLPDEARTQAAGQAARFDAAGLSHMIALCEGLSRSSRSSSAPRAMLDATVVRLALAEKMADVTALLSGPGSGGAAVGGGGSKKKVSEADTRAAVEHDLRQRREARGVAASEVIREAAALTPMDEQAGQGEAALPVDMTPAAVWAHVLSRHADRAAVRAWLGAMELASLEGQVARLRAKPGRRDVMRLMSDSRRSQLAQMLGEATGRSWRVEVTAPAGLEAGGGHEEGSGHGAAGDRQAALDLPLVRQIMDQFDVTLMQVRREQDESEEARPQPQGQAMTDGPRMDDLSEESPGEQED